MEGKHAGALWNTATEVCDFDTPWCRPLHHGWPFDSYMLQLPCNLQHNDFNTMTGSRYLKGCHT